MFNNESKILKKIYLGDKFSIVIHLVYFLNILPQLMYNSTKFKEGGYRKQLTIAWLFWDVTFYYEVKQNNPTTKTVVDGSLVNDFLHQQLEPAMVAKKEAEEKEKLEEKLPDGVDYTKIKLEMVRANDLFKDKWKEVSSALNSPSPVFGCPKNYVNYTIFADDLADVNLKIKGGFSSLDPQIIQEEHDYFNRHFKSMTINQTDLEDWSKLEKEWLESGNKITPIPKEEGRVITKEDIIHTIAFVQPLELNSYIKSALCDQKEKGKYSLSGDIDTILTGAYKQANISESKTKRENIVKESWKKFNEKYGGSIGINDCYLSLKLFCDSTLFDNSERIKKFFIDNYSDNWVRVQDYITKNYYFNSQDYRSINSHKNHDVFKKILKDIFDIDAESTENEYVRDYYQKYLWDIKFTLNDLDRPVESTWDSELYKTLEVTKCDPRGSCECILASRLVKYAYAPSRNWGINSFYDKIHEARLEFDKELLTTLYSKKWKEVYNSIQTTGKYEVTMEDLKQGSIDYYSYIKSKAPDLVYFIQIDEIIEKLNKAFNIKEYQKFEITKDIYDKWCSDVFFEDCGGLLPVYPIEELSLVSDDDYLASSVLIGILIENRKIGNLKEDILAHSYIFAPPACMTDFCEKDKDQCSIEEKAMEAVRIIQEAADEAIESLKNDK